VTTTGSTPPSRGADRTTSTDPAPQEVAGTTGHVPSKRPENVLAGPYGHPFHPVLVTLPIGSFTASLLFDLGGRADLVDPAMAAFAAAWLLVIGCVGAVVAAVWGTMDLVTIPNGTKAARTGLAHAIANVVAVVLLGLSAGIRFTNGLDEVPALALGLSVAGLLVLGLGGWLGGKLAYTYGVRVAREARQDEAYRPSL
jgi:uncharacterized membrane protein